MTIASFPTPTPARSSPDIGRSEALTLDEALVLNRVTEHAWQICDSRHASQSPGYLLGFVEETKNGVELMQLGNKFIWTRFPTMRDAPTHVVNTAYITATQRAARDLAWIS